jgi:hypothetical protein
MSINLEKQTMQSASNFDKTNKMISNTYCSLHKQKDNTLCIMYINIKKNIIPHIY